MLYKEICWLLLVRCIFCSQKVFSVNDDVFAYPQYEIDFSPSYILESDANAKLLASKSRTDAASSLIEDASADEEEYVDYEQLILHGRSYLCSIPLVNLSSETAEEQPSKDEQQKELVRAADRGWQLLQDMEGKQCLYYSTGWWSYAFCYNSYVKQFHSLPAASGGARSWPPVEDQTTPSYVLGKYEPPSPNQETVNSDEKQGTTGLQTRADGNYLVQKLEGGTPCDLTGKNRKVEIEFHCHPQTTDRIGWIKETTTCTYLMVVYTPRLCNDVAFQPPRDSQAHPISCQEILSISQAAHLSPNEDQPATIEPGEDEPIVIGNIKVGAMAILGKDAKKLERGRIVMTAEEKAEVIIMQKDGQIQGPSKRKLKELNIKPDEMQAIEGFKKELQKLAGDKDWKIELVDENGQLRLQGIVATDSEGGEDRYIAGKDEEESEEVKESVDKPRQEL